MGTSTAPEAAAQDDDEGITNVFVLMLENHSFDNVFAMSGIRGIRAATTEDSNTWRASGDDRARTAHVTDGAPWRMTTDPGHEFEDVLKQLCNVLPCCPPGGTPETHTTACNNDSDCYGGGTYPDVTLSGFAANYASSTSEDTGRPDTAHVPDIMACFHTPTQLPVIHQLATEFAICDNWYSSLPGPTWPNRFFVHGASSAGVAQSPRAGQEVVWETVHGFEFENGSIFHRLTETGHDWRLYQDKHNDFSDDPSPWHQGGWISQVASLKGVSLLDVDDLRGFRDDLHRRTEDGRAEYLDVPYTFIEPNFGASFFAKQGDAPGPTYRGGSAQHPEDDPSGGEGLIRSVYEAIRTSPVWDTSVLIVVYDEHGGFYDSARPGRAVSPGDSAPRGHEKLNEFGFDFAHYGARVPAVVVSPRIPKGTVDRTLYDHTSVLATVERLLGIAPLTKRDAAAHDVRHLLSLPEPRTDCPTTLVDPAVVPPPAQEAASAVEPVQGATSERTHPDQPAPADAPFPTRSNAAGFLHVLVKTELELAGDDAEAHRSIKDRFAGISTIGHAVDYLRSMEDRLRPTSRGTNRPHDRRR